MDSCYVPNALDCTTHTDFKWGLYKFVNLDWWYFLALNLLHCEGKGTYGGSSGFEAKQQYQSKFPKFLICSTMCWLRALLKIGWMIWSDLKVTYCTIES